MRNAARLTLLVALAASPGAAHATTNLLAKEHRFGLGLGGGSLASGATAKTFLAEVLSVQATVGVWPERGIAACADLLFEGPQAGQFAGIGVNWYAGAGGAAMVGVGAGLAFGVSGVVGASAQLASFPLEVTFEYRPTFVISDAGGGCIGHANRVPAH